MSAHSQGAARDCGSAFDFEYVSGLPKHQQAIAAFYEYARESSDLVRMVLEIRRAGLLTKHSDPSVVVGLTLGHTRHIDPAQIIMLVDCHGFPKQPFATVRSRAGMKRHLQNVLFGRRCLGLASWDELFALWERFGNEPRIWELSDRRSLHVISFPWEYTDDELTEFFPILLKVLRPKECPQPAKSGRKGRSQGMGALDMLRQLAAYRCDREGIKVYDPRVRKYPGYVSERGWRDAMKSARERIATMTTKRFYGG